MKQTPLNVFSSYWAAFTDRIHASSWGQVLIGCFMVLIAGIVLHLTTIAKLIIAITMFHKLFLRKPAQKKVVPILESASSMRFDGEDK